MELSAFCAREGSSEHRPIFRPLELARQIHRIPFSSLSLPFQKLWFHLRQPTGLCCHYPVRPHHERKREGDTSHYSWFWRGGNVCNWKSLPKGSSRLQPYNWTKVLLCFLPVHGGRNRKEKVWIRREISSDLIFGVGRFGKGIISWVFQRFAFHEWTNRDRLLFRFG